jgi:hypothetical protein
MASYILENYKNTYNISCIYLLKIGNVSELRKEMSIDEIYEDDYVILKFGLTTNLQNRINDHYVKYNKIDGSNIELLYFSNINKNYLTKAENEIKRLAIIYKCYFKYKNEKELIIVHKNYISYIKQYYDIISNKIDNLISELILNDKFNKSYIKNEKTMISRKNKYIKINIKKIKKDKKTQNNNNNEHINNIKHMEDKLILKEDFDSQFNIFFEKYYEKIDDRKKIIKMKDVYIDLCNTDFYSSLNKKNKQLYSYKYILKYVQAYNITKHNYIHKSSNLSNVIYNYQKKRYN